MPFTFLDVKPAAEIPGEALGEARFEFTEGLAITVLPSKDAETLWIRLSAVGDGPEAARLEQRWAGWAYQVGVWKEKAFLPRLGDLAARAPAAETTAPPPGAIPGTPP